MKNLSDEDSTILSSGQVRNAGQHSLACQQKANLYQDLNTVPTPRGGETGSPHILLFTFIIQEHERRTLAPGCEPGIGPLVFFNNE